jgi:hypothetical protein
MNVDDMLGSHEDDSGMGADATGIVRCESDVATFSPAGSPGVLEFPVAFLVDSHQEDGMAEAGLAVVEDSTLVVAPVCSIDRYGNRKGQESIGKSTASVDLQFSAYFETVALGQAGLVPSCIGVRLFGRHSPTVGVFKARDGLSSVAAIGAEAL